MPLGHTPQHVLVEFKVQSVDSWLGSQDQDSLRSSQGVASNIEKMAEAMDCEAAI